MPGELLDHINLIVETPNGSGGTVLFRWLWLESEYITVKLVLENNDCLKLPVYREERTSVNLSVAELAKKNLTFLVYRN